MPELRLSLFDRSVELHVFLHLDDKADLCRVTEVRDGKSADLLNERLPCELQFVLALLNQVLDFVWLKLHDAADAQLRCPFTLIQVA